MPFVLVVKALLVVHLLEVFVVSIDAAMII